MMNKTYNRLKTNESLNFPIIHLPNATLVSHTASYKIDVSTDNGRSICIVFQGVFMIANHILLVVSE